MCQQEMQEMNRSQLSRSSMFLYFIKILDGKDPFSLVARYLKTLSTSSSVFTPGIRARMFLTGLLNESVEYNNLPEIDVAIVTSIQEIKLLDLSLNSLVASSENPIRNTYLVGPKSQQIEILSRITCPVTYIKDEDLLSSEMLQYIETSFPLARVGWIKQQVLKFKISLVSSTSGVLIVDADTVLLKKRAWFDGNRQILLPSIEFHLPYHVHLNTYLELGGLKPIQQKISFVTHHQFFQKKIVEEFFTLCAPSVDEGIMAWLKLISFLNSESPACEWHCYGSFLLTRNSKNVDLIQWKNAASSREEIEKLLGHNLNVQDVDQLRLMYPNHYSISMHHYL
jgi:hypothetical protein